MRRALRLGLGAALLALAGCSASGQPLDQALPLEHRAWVSEAPPELRAETWISRRAPAAHPLERVITTNGSLDIPLLKVATPKSKRLSPERVRTELELRALRVEEGTKVLGVRYAIFARASSTADEAPFEGTKRRLQGTPLATGVLREGRVTGERVTFAGPVEVPCRPEESLPTYTASFLLLTSRGFRRIVFGVSGGGPFVEPERE